MGSRSTTLCRRIVEVLQVRESTHISDCLNDSLNVLIRELRKEMESEGHILTAFGWTTEQEAEEA